MKRSTLVTFSMVVIAGFALSVGSPNSVLAEEPKKPADAAGVKASKELLVGEWEASFIIDEAKLRAFLKVSRPVIKGLPDGDRVETDDEIDARIKRTKDKMLSRKMTWTFNEDGTGSITGVGRPAQKSKWSVVNLNGSKMNLNFGPQEEDGSLPTVEFTSSDSFIFTPPKREAERMQGVTIIFTRKKK